MAEVELANGKSVREICKGLEISEHTYYRWRREYGGMNTTRAKKLKELWRKLIAEALSIDREPERGFFPPQVS